MNFGAFNCDGKNRLVECRGFYKVDRLERKCIVLLVAFFYCSALPFCSFCMIIIEGTHTMKDNLFVAAVDVGTFKNWGLAYWDGEGRCDSLPEHNGHFDLVDKIARALEDRTRRVALGFEAPLWVPIRSRAEMLLKSREGESNRPWSAGAGCAVTTASLAVLPWWFSAIAKELSCAPLATTDVLHWEPGVLFVWEAFVSSQGKRNKDPQRHDQDAAKAVKAFWQKATKGEWTSDLAHPSKESGDGFLSLVKICLEASLWHVEGGGEIPPLVVKSLHP